MFSRKPTKLTQKEYDAFISKLMSDIIKTVTKFTENKDRSKYILKQIVGDLSIRLGKLYWADEGQEKSTHED